ncbi:MAG: D-alanyl-D-alanine carboxypeptidase [Xanthomonadales bacterium]|nr:D-alanyl-D-alanine carboxypeptidase [Xanthomonadales bacterium]
MTASVKSVFASLVLSACFAAQGAVPAATPLSLPANATASSAAPVPPPPSVSAKHYVLVDFQTGRVLAEQGGDERVPPASITKIMTSYVVAAERKAGKIKDDDLVSISENAWRHGGAVTDGSTSFLELNSQVPLKDLLMGMIIQSGNDASIAIAEHVAGSESTFAALMNQYAQQLGLKNSHFVNAHGLFDPEHYMSAHDIATLSRALIRDFPGEYAHYSLKEYTWNQHTQRNRNILLWRDPSVDGIKTGHLSQAGYCLAASAKRGDTRLIAVVMNTAGEKVRADEAHALLNYGFRFFETHKVYEAMAPVSEVTLWHGEAEKASLGLAQPVLVTVPRGSYARLSATMKVAKPLSAPLHKGQVVGSLTLALDGQAVYEAPLVALADYAEGGFFKRMSDSVWLWFDDGE